MEAPDQATAVRIGFDKGDPVSLDGKKLSPAAILTELNALGKTNGIGRIDLVENRFVGMKSRGVYETPGGTILLAAHRAIESITLDRGAAHLKDELMPRYASLVYRGLWFAPERRMLQTAIDWSQREVTGEVMLLVYRGSVQVLSRQSPFSRYDRRYATFEADDVFDQHDATGWLRVTTLRFRAERGRAGSPPVVVAPPVEVEVEVEVAAQPAIVDVLEPVGGPS
jgi:argininosuccinate synthase